MAKLAHTVFVADPDHHGVTLRLDAGQEVPEHLQAAVTNEDAWEDGKLPAAAKKAAEEQSTPEPSPEGDEGDKPAAKKTAANRPARGRKSAADEGEGS
ncbi:hypothetical protein AB0B07_33615 [Streptomyces sioyaensis]|uniref:hypothetical protein n=1 Tax=Streptomyces sioyaensis TaxID=67364 RepID=UPI0033C4561B